MRQRRRGQTQTQAQRARQLQPLSDPLTHADLQVLYAIVQQAEQHCQAAKQPVTLLEVLDVYERELPRRGIRPSADVRLYHALLSLNLDYADYDSGEQPNEKDSWVLRLKRLADSNGIELQLDKPSLIYDPAENQPHAERKGALAENQRVITPQPEAASAPPAFVKKPQHQQSRGETHESFAANELESNSATDEEFDIRPAPLAGKPSESEAGESVLSEYIQFSETSDHSQANHTVAKKAPNLHNVVLRQCFREWKSVIEVECEFSRVKIRMQDAKAQCFWEEHLVLRAFQHWRHYSAVESEASKLLSAADSFCFERRVRGALLSWRWSIARRRFLGELCRRLSSLHQQLQLGILLHAWMKALYLHRLRLSEIDNTLQRKRGLHLLRAWRQLLHWRRTNQRTLMAESFRIWCAAFDERKTVPIQSVVYTRISITWLEESFDADIVSVLCRAQAADGRTLQYALRLGSRRLPRWKPHCFEPLMLAFQELKASQQRDCFREWHAVSFCSRRSKRRCFHALTAASKRHRAIAAHVVAHHRNRLCLETLKAWHALALYEHNARCATTAYGRLRRRWLQRHVLARWSSLWLACCWHRRQLCSRVCEHWQQAQRQQLSVHRELATALELQRRHLALAALRRWAAALGARCVRKRRDTTVQQRLACTRRRRWLTAWNTARQAARLRREQLRAAELQHRLRSLAQHVLAWSEAALNHQLTQRQLQRSAVRRAVHAWLRWVQRRLRARQRALVADRHHVHAVLLGRWWWWRRRARDALTDRLALQFQRSCRARRALRALAAAQRNSQALDRERLQPFVQARLCTMVRTALVHWADALHIRTRLQHLAARVDYARQRRQAVLVLHRWQHALHHVQVLEQHAETLAFSTSRDPLYIAYHAWRRAYNVRCHGRHFLVFRELHYVLPHFWRCWRDSLLAQRRRRVSERASVRAVLAVRQRHVLHAWTQAAHRQSRGRQLRVQRLWRLLQHWRASANRHRRRRQHERQAEDALQRHRQRRCVSTWRVHVRRCRRRRRRLALVVRRQTLASTHEALLAWRAFCALCSVDERIRARTEQRCRARVLAAWYLLQARRTELRRLRRMCTLQHYWRRWQRAADERTALHDAVERAEHHFCRCVFLSLSVLVQRRCRARLAAQHCIVARLHRLWQQWRQAQLVRVVRARRRRHVLDVWGRALQRHRRAITLRHWRETTSRRMRLRSLSTLLSERRRQLSMRLSWARWRRRQRLARCNRHLRLRRVLLSLRRLLEARRSMRHRVALLQRLRRSRLAAAGIRLWRARARRSQALAEREVAVRAAHARLVLDAWRRQARLRQRAAVVRRRRVRRLWSAWRRRARASTASRVAVQLTTWRRWCLFHSRKRALQRYHREVKHRVHCLPAQAQQQLRRRLLPLCSPEASWFVRWRLLRLRYEHLRQCSVHLNTTLLRCSSMRLMSDWRRAALLRRLLRKVAAAWYKALLVLSVRSWSCWSLARRSLRRSRSSVRERHRRALLSSALSVWQQRLLTSWSLKAREQRLHQISHAFVQRRALRLWHTELCLVRHRRLSLDLAVCHHASHLQRSAFRALKKHAQRVRVALQQMKANVERARLLLQKCCFDAWLGVAEQQQQQRCAERLQELRCLCLSECFSAWRIYTRRINDMRLMLLDSTSSRGAGGSSVPSTNTFFSAVRVTSTSGGLTTAEHFG